MNVEYLSQIPRAKRIETEMEGRDSTVSAASKGARAALSGLSGVETMRLGTDAPGHAEGLEAGFVAAIFVTGGRDPSSGREDSDYADTCSGTA